MSSQIALEKHWKSGLTQCSPQLCGPSGVSASHQEQTWSRSWNHLSPGLSFADCSIWGVLVSSPGAGGVGRGVMGEALSWCSMQSSPMKWSTSLCKPASCRGLSCTFNTSCDLVHSHRRYQPSPVVHIRAVITSPRTAYFFGANAWDQIYPWYNSIGVTGVLHLRQMWSYCIKADFLPFIYFSMNLK